MIGSDVITHTTGCVTKSTGAEMCWHFHCFNFTDQRELNIPNEVSLELPRPAGDWGSDDEASTNRSGQLRTNPPPPSYGYTPSGMLHRATHVHLHKQPGEKRNKVRYYMYVRSTRYIDGHYMYRASFSAAAGSAAQESLAKLLRNPQD